MTKFDVEVDGEEVKPLEPPSHLSIKHNTTCLTYRTSPEKDEPMIRWWTDEEIEQIKYRIQRVFEQLGVPPEFIYGKERGELE